MSSPQKRAARSFDIHCDDDASSTSNAEMKRTAAALPLPLTTSKLANKLATKHPRESPKKAQAEHKTEEHDVLDELMAKLNEHQNSKHEGGVPLEDDSSSQNTDPFADNTPPAGSTATSDSNDMSAMDDMKRQLEEATERMAQMELELNKTRLRQHSSQQDLTHSRFNRTVEQQVNASFPPASQSFPVTSLGVPHIAYNAPASDSRRPSPLDLNSQQATLTLNGAYQSGTLAPPPFFAGQAETSAPFSRPTSAYAARPMRETGPTTPTTPFVQNFNHPQLNQIYGQHGSQPFPTPIGTRLSPTASDFTGQWQSTAHQAMTQQGPHYVNTVEPLNYRRLLDRAVGTNWRYIVDKIVHNNDQQASIFLQQKLKIGTPEHRFEIVQAIIDQAYPLMVNRFGNFLIQRCFENGTPEQVVGIAQAIRGNTLNLSMDAFGCHVVQKAFDNVPEEYKAIMVHELLRRIPETVIHRYACHVWQKLFELRWSGSPPQIMKYVNEALRGMWHEVALGETGSLVVQNIFENCLEDDKRPCINEVLASIDVVAHGQFGNWCIQHICEHGALPDRNRAVDHVLRYATEYSMDQFASKVVEKCLKIGGPEFLDRYLDVVCEARADRPRMPLVDISGDQFGNYLIQYILANADPHRREIVAAHIRKHMVSLRGSKYGSRVAMLCSNPAAAIRPGPPTGLSRNNSRYPEHSGYDAGGRGYHNDRGFIGMGRNGGYR